MQNEGKRQKQDLDKQLNELELSLKEVEQKYQLLRKKGKDLLTTARGNADAARLADIRSRLGI